MKYEIYKPEMFQYMMPMGRIKSVPSVSEIIGTPEARAGIASFEREMADYSSQVARRMAQNYRRQMAAEAFKRSQNGWTPGKILSNFLSKTNGIR